MSEPERRPGPARRTGSGLFRRFRRSAMASDLLPEAVERRLGLEGTARPEAPRPGRAPTPGEKR